MEYSVERFDARQDGLGQVRVEAALKGVGCNGFAVTHRAVYTIGGSDGAVDVANDVNFAGPRIPLARMGVRMLLDKRLDRFDYLGRGPIENYADRKQGFDVGLYSTGVNDQYAYEKPMERGNHGDVRWAALTGGDLPGLLAQPNRGLMQAAALPHTDEQMMPVEYKIDLPPAGPPCLPGPEDVGRGLGQLRARAVGEVVVWSRPAKFFYVLRLLPPGEKPTPARPRPLPRQLPREDTPSTNERMANKSRWRIVSCSSFQEGEGEPEHAIDGDTATYGTRVERTPRPATRTSW